jgi:hypothetical protein
MSKMNDWQQKWGTEGRWGTDYSRYPMSLIDHLQEQGYEPNFDHVDGHGRQDWYDLVVSGYGTIRTVISPDDGWSAEVHVFDEHMANEWSARFTPGTPDTAIIGVLEAAEWQLADRRGGPVTPAQASSAR